MVWPDRVLPLASTIVPDIYTIILNTYKERKLLSLSSLEIRLISEHRSLRIEGVKDSLDEDDIDSSINQCFYLFLVRISDFLEC